MSKERVTAFNLWTLVQDPSKIKNTKIDLGQKTLNNIIRDVASTDHPKVKNTRPEVITVAKFIANISPSYKNSEGRYIWLEALRAQPNFTKEDTDYLAEKIEGIVKPYIVVTSETRMDRGKLRIKSNMPKKRLIHAAVNHLLNGSEVLANPDHYHELKARSLFLEQIKGNYAWLIGFALSLEYKSVPEMMEEMCLTFIDQTESLREHGQVIFYDGAIRVENL